MIDVTILFEPDAPNLRALIAAEVTAYMLRALGIDLPPERQARIAEELDFWVSVGAGGAWGFSQALSLELALYGDPTRSTSDRRRGILDNPKLREATK